MPQDRDAVAQVGAQVKQIMLRCANDLDPEWHDLHIALRRRTRNGVFAKSTFHFNQTEHHFRVKAGTYRFVMQRIQKVAPIFCVGNTPLQAARHLGQPGFNLWRISKSGLSHRGVGNGF